MESTSARDLDRRLADLVRSERHLAVQFVVELAGFAKRDLYRELGYTSLFHYCVRQLGLSKSSAFRRSEVARLIARFPVIADRLAEGRLSIRALVELREALTEENHTAVLSRAEGKSPAPIAPFAPPGQSALPAPLGAHDPVPAETESPLLRPEVVKPLTPELRRLNVTVTAEFIDELEQVRVALSHQCPDGNFEQVVREAFKLVLERDRKRKAQTHRPRAPTDRPRAQSETAGESDRATPENDRYIPAAVKRAVWERDKGRCTWPMGDGKVCARFRKDRPPSEGPPEHRIWERSEPGHGRGIAPSR
jgi:hypothetical protein